MNHYLFKLTVGVTVTETVTEELSSPQPSGESAMQPLQPEVVREFGKCLEYI